MTRLLYPSTIDIVPCILCITRHWLGSTPAKAAVRVSWIDLADNERGFRIYRRHGGAKWKHIADVGRDVLSFDDTHVVRGTDYTYAVRAFNGHGSSPRMASLYSVYP